jgi:hypothetical protein
MSFPLRPDVDHDVLAAFASIAVPRTDSPELPPAVRDDSLEWQLDGECDMSDPWAHDWGTWLAASYSATIDSDQRASMLWHRDHWVVTCRATWKSMPEGFVGNLAVLGTVIDAGRAQRYDSWVTGAEHLSTGFFVGYARHELEPRPWLLWADGASLHAENLNPPSFML